jgi:hypothetical protein
MSPIVKSARCHRVINATKPSNVPSVRRPSATIVKTSNIAICARRHTVVSVKIISTVNIVVRPPVLSAKMCPSVRSATSNFVTTAAIIFAFVTSAIRYSVMTAMSSTIAKAARRCSVVGVKIVSAVKSVGRPPALSAKMDCKSINTTASICTFVATATRHYVVTAMSSSTTAKAAISFSVVTFSKNN